MSVSEEARKAAERAMPGWVVVEKPDPVKTARRVDSVAVDIETLKRRYFGTPEPATPPVPEPQGETETVVMRVKGRDADILGNKTVIVRDGRIIGMQG